jgi:hypothetical protein
MQMDVDNAEIVPIDNSSFGTLGNLYRNATIASLRSMLDVCYFSLIQICITTS